MKSSRSGGVDLSVLLKLFPDAALLERYEWVPAGEVPEPYRTLLVHHHHMTVTMERFHGDRVALQIIHRSRNGDSYARKILLALEGSGRVVQFGIVRIDFRFCDEAVRDAILEGRTPLGRILIEHNVMREIQSEAYLRIRPGETLCKHFGMSEPREVYGRTATIFCNGDPAIELLEVSAPVD